MLLLRLHLRARDRSLHEVLIRRISPLQPADGAFNDLQGHHQVLSFQKYRSHHQVVVGSLRVGPLLENRQVLIMDRLSKSLENLEEESIQPDHQLLDQLPAFPAKDQVLSATLPPYQRQTDGKAFLKLNQQHHHSTDWIDSFRKRIFEARIRSMLPQLVSLRVFQNGTEPISGIKEEHQHQQDHLGGRLGPPSR